MRKIYCYSDVNFTNILQAAFGPISFRQKNTTSRKYKKAARKTFVQKAARKMLVKLTPDVVRLEGEKFHLVSNRGRTYRMPGS